MKPYQANLINAILLILIGLWGYFSATSNTALIPVGFGMIFAFSTPLFKKDNKVVAHIVVLLTFLLIFALIKPLLRALDNDNTMAVVRVCLMMASCVFAMIIFIRSFIEVRRARKAAEG